jgi:uncharacterized protein (DUF2252 family)
VFDVNDFDETLPGPWERDVKRLAASMLIAARDNGFREKAGERIVLDTVGAYRTAMASFAGMTNLDVWYAHLDLENALKEYGSQFTSKVVKGTNKTIAKARTKDSMAAFSKLTYVVDGQPRILDQPPVIVPIDQLAPGEDRDELFERLHEVLRGYRESLGSERRGLLEQFTLTDFAGKVVGVGSIGTRAWIALLLGRDGQDPLFLQIKEADASVLEELLGPSEFSNHGQRVVAGQRLMQATSDIFLGWLHVNAEIEGVAPDYYARQLKDWKASAEIEQMDRQAMARYGTLCGLDAGPRTCSQRRPHRDRGVPRERRQLRPRPRGVLQGLRRPERTRLPGTGCRRRLRQDRCSDGPVTQPSDAHPRRV